MCLTSRLSAAAVVVCCTGSLACDPPERPWDGPRDGAVVDESAPWLPRPADASWLTDATIVADDDDAGPLRPSAVGGLWVSCYGGFHPADDPQRDVTRLGLLCGPPNGMQRAPGAAQRGSVAAGAEPARFSFPAVRGECYRLFAVASEPIRDLDVTVRSSRGSVLAKDHGEDRWPILDPERPFCTFADDTFTVELSTREGAGRWAVEVWTLPTSPRATR